MNDAWASHVAVGEMRSRRGAYSNLTEVVDVTGGRATSQLLCVRSRKAHTGAHV